MKTAVLMKRELFGQEVEQNSKTEMFNATSLAKAGNVWRAANGMAEFNLSQWLKSKSTVEFIEALQAKHGNVISVSRGRKAGTWVHPLLFIDIALAISPQLKIEVYEWLFDNLVKYRNESGDSYKRMAGALYVRAENKTNFPHYMQDVANKIKLACNIEDWQSASESQLKQRDKIHDAITLLSDVLRSNDEAVRLAILKNI
jgi:hypothetical protein